MCMVAADWQAKEWCERPRQELTQQRAALEDWAVLAVMQSQHETLKVQRIQRCKVSRAQPVGRYAKRAQCEGQKAQNIDQAGCQGLVSWVFQLPKDAPGYHCWQWEEELSPLCTKVAIGADLRLLQAHEVKESLRQCHPKGRTTIYFQKVERLRNSSGGQLEFQKYRDQNLKLPPVSHYENHCRAYEKSKALHLPELR